MQDDYLDCFGVDIGKIGTDILDNKCSWVVCTALQVRCGLGCLNKHLSFGRLQLASPAQRAILDANYGRKDSTSEARCKALFEELGLRACYTAYEEDAYARINALIDIVPEKDYGGSVSVLFLFCCVGAV